MKDRILKFLSMENKTSAQFAEEIGVQPSGVSHILSGRNNPSLDFVVKMLTRYPNLSTEWLLFGREPMYRRIQEPTLFDQLPIDEVSPPVSDGNVLSVSGDRTSDISSVPESESDNLLENEALNSEGVSTKREKSIARIVFFYKDKSFREFHPED